MLYDDSRKTSYPVLTPEDMRRAEQRAFDAGVPSLLLMEHAAEAVVDQLEKALGNNCRGREVLFLCGPGNNGGDGLAAARLFAMRGGQPQVWLSARPQTPDAQTNLRWLERIGPARILNLEGLSPAELPFTENGLLRPYDGYVDALLGTGFRGKPEGLMARMIQAVNRSSRLKSLRKPVIAVDIPSGIDGKTGDAPGVFFRADVTVTFHAPKPGLFLTRERQAVGAIVTADIGLWDMEEDSAEARENLEPAWNCRLLTPKALRLLDDRPLAAHKGDCGRVLIYGGSLGMAGAAAMCAKAAVTAGAGLTTVACPRDVIPILQALVPNAMCADIGRAAEEPPAYDALALGCGLGKGEEAWRNLLALWDPERPSVWDADALNLLAEHPRKLGAQAVMTPHPGEAARLLQGDVRAVLSDRVEAARALAEKYGCVVVLKGDVSLICRIDEQGKPVYGLNAVGTPALAKGGSGDALTGILAALLCRPGRPGIRAFDAARYACLWHGYAGVIGEQTYGRLELTTDQLIGCLHQAESLT